MLFLEYEDFKNKCLETQKMYDAILAEKEELFQRTQPQAVNAEKEKVVGGGGNNAFDIYIMEKDRKQIDERLAEVKSLLDDRKQLMALKYQELRASKDVKDKVYRLRFIEHKRVYLIAKYVNYSEAHVYRIIDFIQKRINERK